MSSYKTANPQLPLESVNKMYRRNTASSIMESFSLSPFPCPLILLLLVIFFFLGLQWYLSYESVVEAAEETMGWLLMVVPLVLLFAVRWLSTVDASGWWFSSPWDGRRRERHMGAVAGEGGSPWGVAAVIVLLLVLVQFQSVFLESWFG